MEGSDSVPEVVVLYGWPVIEVVEVLVHVVVVW